MIILVPQQTCISCEGKVNAQRTGTGINNEVLHRRAGSPRRQNPRPKIRSVQGLAVRNLEEKIHRVFALQIVILVPQHTRIYFQVNANVQRTSINNEVLHHRARFHFSDQLRFSLLGQKSLPKIRVVQGLVVRNLEEKIRCILRIRELREIYVALVRVMRLQNVASFQGARHLHIYLQTKSQTLYTIYEYV